MSTKQVNHTGKKITKYFNDRTTAPGLRREASLRKKWQKIQHTTAKFCGYKAEQDRRKQSGKGETERIEDAKTVYRSLERHNFPYLHCWEVLRDENKWKAVLTGKEEDDEDDDEDIQLRSRPEASVGGESVRPLGRDSSKKRRSSEINNSQEAGSIAEVMQKKLQMLADHHLENQGLLRRHVEIQEKHVNVLALQEERALMMSPIDESDKWAAKWLRLQKARIWKQARAQAAEEPNAAAEEEDDSE